MMQDVISDTYCWGVRKSDGIPNKYVKVSRNAETRNPEKSIHVSKVVIPFTLALGPPL
jgi:hypothetical protein